FVAAVLDPAAHSVTLVNAGHPRPLLIHPHGGPGQEAGSAEANGLPLGVMEGQRYAVAELPLRPGDCLLLFSDGVTDALDTQGRALGKSVFSTALQGAHRAPKALGQHLL